MKEDLSQHLELQLPEQPERAVELSLGDELPRRPQPLGQRFDDDLTLATMVDEISDPRRLVPEGLQQSPTVVPARHIAHASIRYRMVEGVVISCEDVRRSVGGFGGRGT